MHSAGDNDRPGILGCEREEANAIDLYSVDAAQPGELAALYADVSYVSVVGGLHIYDTTFEVPVADGLHSVVGAFPADMPSGFHTLSNHAIQCQCAPLVGDFDSNGTVGTSDLMQLLTALGSFNATYDLDGDGVVATADLMVFLATYGQTGLLNSSAARPKSFSIPSCVCLGRAAHS